VIELLLAFIRQMVNGEGGDYRLKRTGEGIMSGRESEIGEVQADPRPIGG